MKLFMYLRILLLLCPSLLNGQSSDYSLQRSLLGIGAYGRAPDAFSFLTNRAALASIRESECALYTVQHFMMNELRTYYGAGVWKSPIGNMGVNLQYSGTGDYAVQRIEVAYAKLLGRIEAGAGFAYFSERVAGYSGSHGLSGAFAIRAKLGEKFIVGWQVMNFPAFQSKVPVYAVWHSAMGIGYSASKDLLFIVDVNYSQAAVVDVHAGFLYNFQKKFFAGGGIHADVNSWYGGAGWQYNKLRLLVTVSQHPFLGMSPGLAISHKL